MFIILVLFSWVCLYGAKIYTKGEFNNSYLSREDTTAMKGIFVFMVFMSHFTQYYDMTTVYDNPYKLLKKFLGQLVVVVFLFYSGYGVFESIKKKGSAYVKSFPKNRVLKVMLHLDFAILLYVILDLALGKTIKLKSFVLSLIGWESIGNSNWYVFAILALYLCIWIAFTLFKKNNIAAISAVTVLSVVYIIVMKQVKETWWYDTALCLPAGMWYSFFKEKIEKITMKNDVLYLICLALTGAAFLFAHKYTPTIEGKIVTNTIFGILVCLVMMKIHFGNKALEWLGNHVFSVYILQRIPMTIFARVDVISGNRYLYFFLSLIVTVIISEIFDRFVSFADKKIFISKAKKI